MSLFKLKQWWITHSSENSDTSGLQNGQCIKVDKLEVYNDSDCLFVGQGENLSVYQPNQHKTTSPTLLETRLNDIVLQIETGKFISNSQDRQILVLHPKSYEIYQLDKKEGLIEAGDQNILSTVLQHSFSRKAYSVTCGTFGSIKTRDLICVQGLDGSLSFFDQDSFLFFCLFDDVIIPGPIAYVGSSDLFVICKSSWVLEIYSYQQLRDTSELSARQNNKKNIPQWHYNAGEEVTSLQVIQTSNNISSILALGERHLCCFQDNGLMKYTIKFEFMPMCFYAYLIGWYYEPAARLLVMVASDDSKLYVYESVSLLWCCDLISPAISVSRCFLKSLAGGLVTLSPNGTVIVSYLGTEPDLNPQSLPTIKENLHPEKIQEELLAAEDDLQKIMNDKDVGDFIPNTDQIISIKGDVGKPVENLLQNFAEGSTSSHVISPVVLVLTFKEPKSISNLLITYFCCPPFSLSENTICLDNVNGTEIIETQVFISNDYDISDATIKVFFTITLEMGSIIVVPFEMRMPLSLFCIPYAIDETDDKIILTLKSSQPCIDLTKVFTDFTELDLNGYGNTKDTITFLYQTTKKKITIKARDKKYLLEAEHFTDIPTILEYVVIHLNEHFARLNDSFKYDLEIDEEALKHILHSFMKSIELHARERITLKKLEEELKVLHAQFTLVQKKLLVQYGSLPPGDCDPLEFLMRDTYNRIRISVQDILQSRDSVCRAGNTLSSIGSLLIIILKSLSKDAFEIRLVEELLSLNSLNTDYQEWEEIVTQGLSYTLNNILKHSEKEKEKLTPVTEQGILSHVNLKRFLKQIRMLIEKLYYPLLLTDEHNTEGQRILRIEELVEVI